MNCVNCGHSEDSHAPVGELYAGAPRACLVQHPGPKGSFRCDCNDFIRPKKRRMRCSGCEHLFLDSSRQPGDRCDYVNCGGTLYEETEPETSKPETVDHPQHYGGDTTYEHIKVVRAWGLNYELGNATKYICRAGKKDQSKTVEDLEKAVWYLRAEIERRKQETK